MDFDSGKQLSKWICILNFSYAISNIIFGAIFFIIGLLLGICVSPIWFARFGALIVLFAVMAEYSLVRIEMNNIYQTVKGRSGVWNDNPWDIDPPKIQKVTSRLAHALVVLGTFVWGFGDWALRLLVTG